MSEANIIFYFKKTWRPKVSYLTHSHACYKIVRRRERKEEELRVTTKREYRKEKRWNDWMGGENRVRKGRKRMKRGPEKGELL